MKPGTMDKETKDILSDTEAMKDIRTGIGARRKKSKDYYVEWERVMKYDEFSGKGKCA